MKTPAQKSVQKELKSALKSGKGTDAKKKTWALCFQEETPKKVVSKVDQPQAKKLVNKNDALQTKSSEKPASKKINEVKPQVVNQAVKRKAPDAVDGQAAKHVKASVFIVYLCSPWFLIVLKSQILDENAVLDEENKRRQERDERSLFIKGFPKNTKTKDLEALHADIETVRHRKGSSFAWLVFRNEAACKKAHDTLSSTKVGGKSLFVDYCGSKSAKAGTVHKETKPINPLELYINGLPPMVSKDDLKNVFRAAVSITIPSAMHHEMKRAFILFSSEDDAKSAFEKGRGLKLGGRSVEVFYARVRQSAPENNPSKPAQKVPAVKPTNVPSAKKSAPAKAEESDSDDSDEEEIESSDEGIEEVPAKASSKSQLTNNKHRRKLALSSALYG
ncbi:hypothetical protein OESDEN_06544 [Oesophagostomum dentatum]|uniref:RRM domain-containing protein n=1 Tax=Oesophagostomum dentatum TaxID=61180 RepID=A0A0B1T8H1_OESDE|nr:hypothetical protein OESDEN_06544 [Oesophagostomum dentatum]